MANYDLAPDTAEDLEAIFDYTIDRWASNKRTATRTSWLFISATLATEMQTRRRF